MKKFFKVVGIGFAVLLVGFIGLGFFLGDTTENMYQEAKVKAERFAAKATKDDCLEEYVSEYKECSEVSCFSQNAMFGVVCLAAASGDQAEFCADKPRSQQDFYESQWANNFCESNGLKGQDCLNVYKVVDTHCSS